MGKKEGPTSHTKSGVTVQDGVTRGSIGSSNHNIPQAEAVSKEESRLPKKDLRPWPVPGADKTVCPVVTLISLRYSRIRICARRDRNRTARCTNRLCLWQYCTTGRDRKQGRSSLISFSTCDTLCSEAESVDCVIGAFASTPVLSDSVSFYFLLNSACHLFQVLIF